MKRNRRANIDDAPPATATPPAQDAAPAEAPTEESAGIELPETLSEGQEAPAQDATPAEAPPEAPAPKYKLAGKEFATAEEMAAYADTIERRAFEAETRLKALNEARGPADDVTPAPTPQSYSERLFVDPDSVLSEVRAEVKQEILDTMRKEREEEAYRRDFYTRHADLRGCEDLVRLAIAENPAWNKLSRSEAEGLLVSHVRKRVERIRMGGGAVVESTHAVMAGATRTPAPRVPAPPQRPKTFAEQLSALQMRRKA